MTSSPAHSTRPRLSAADPHRSNLPVEQLRSDLPLDHQSLIPELSEVRGPYRVCFARTESDLDTICRLRYEVFNLELGEGFEGSHATGRDTDRFDRQCQHLLVRHEASGEVVGTYRLQLGLVAEQLHGYYSATEFDLSSLPSEVLRQSVELGRACIARRHRGHKVLHLLWHGLIEYLRWNEKRYFFGCSSLTSQDPNEGISALRTLEREGHLHPSLSVLPQAGFECREREGARLPRVEIPTLFATYLRYGAKVLGPPAIDRDFKTIDFLTFMDVATMDPEQLSRLDG